MEEDLVLIFQQLICKTGSGARGIVYSYRGSNSIGHVFYVVNQGVTIRFYDTQSTNSNTGYSVNMTGFIYYQLMGENI